MKSEKSEKSQILIRFHKKAQPVRANLAVDPDADGFVLRDGRGHEHHFGGRDLVSGDVAFSYVASYSADGGSEKEFRVRESLEDKGCEVVEPSLGPDLPPLTRAAVANVVEECGRKGFAFDFEKEIAVRSLLALHEANEAFPPGDVEVYGATHGFSLDHAAEFADFAQRIIEGRSLRAAGKAIRLPRGMGERMRDHWRENPAA